MFSLVNSKLLFLFFHSDGPHQWRDSRKPRALLEDYCKTQVLTGPMFYGNNSCKVGSRVYKLTDFGMLWFCLIIVFYLNLNLDLKMVLCFL